MTTANNYPAPANFHAALLRTQAMEAISGNNARKLSAILKQVDDPRVLDVPSTAEEWQDSLLEWATRETSVECARILLASGANPMDTKFESGFCALHILASHAKNTDRRTLQEFVDLFAAAGANFDVKTDLGWTPLHFAVHDGCPEFVEILIRHGVWVDPKLLDDPNMESQILPDPVEEHRPQSVEALRMLRALAMEQYLLSAMLDEAAPAAKSSSAMTL